MQELKKKRRKRPKNELDRGAQKEQKNLTDITEEQLKVNIGIVRLGNMIKVIQIVMKVLLCMLAVLFSFLAILLHEAANWMLADMDKSVYGGACRSVKDTNPGHQS